jgi:uncharacterized protein with ParB-like and HNH nuclease domain
MRATAVSLLELFETKMQLEVPLFQRQYVWQREKHWEPLWEDIARKFTESLDGRKDAPKHFLGAMVLDLKQTPATQHFAISVTNMIAKTWQGNALASP